ncbi:hypothetical protein MNBD_GAMMA15-2288 [hydrothermal vent metagenome]|uniref:Ketopantoate reductase N-terminal domain-containing protein n=1 Tax=hydrothermal vent metagenome TaxID=652676 RepID=A0A3B0Y9R3_9ZZZZ
MKDPVIIIGLGEMGGVFARGFLRSGYPVYPVTRKTDCEALAAELSTPELVLIAVGEKDLHASMEALPEVWRERVALLQNELLPGDWEQYGYSNPTVISVWFEKKKGQDAKVLIPSPAFGPKAALLSEALSSIDIPVTVLDNTEQLLFELVRKNVFILTTNIAGLKTGGTVGELWAQHQEFARNVANEIITVQEKLTGRSLEREALIEGMVTAFNGDLEHKCMGRSAPARLKRALELAERFGTEVPVLSGISGQPDY